jgi:ubiquinone/menaquinone biosynthesis C-methylase UbiE
MKSITHASIWKSSPKEKSKFVSDYTYTGSSIDLIKKNHKIKNVLDVACGNGLGVTLPLLRAGFKVWCFDHVQAALNALKQNVRAEGFAVKAKKSDMYKKFHYKDKSFDASFCIQAIYHGNLKQIKNTLSEMKRVTKKGGYVFVNFLPFDVMTYDKRRKMYYSLVLLKGKVTGKNYYRQDKSDPYLFYPIGNFEHNVPHYFFDKTKLIVLLSSLFKDVKIKKVERHSGRKWFFWFVTCRVK